MNLEYNATYRGAVVTANSNSAQYADSVFNQGTVYSASKGTTATLTGYYYMMEEDFYYLQTTAGVWIILVTNSGWDVREGVYNLPSYTQTQAQALVNKIIRNNSLIVEHNILCARYADKLTHEQARTLRGLQERLQQRDKALKDNGLCQDVQSSYPAWYVDLQQYLVDFMDSNRGVGIAVSTLIYIVVAATVIAGVGTAAYFMYKSYADESEKDLKYSEELTKVLTSKLTEEEYAQLLNETKGILTKSRIKASLGSYGKVLLYVAIAAAGVFAYRFIVKKTRE